MNNQVNNEVKMTEEQTNKPQDELFNFVGYYLGKDFNKKGLTKDKKEWKSYKVRCKDSQNMNSQFDVKFSVFNSCKGFDLLNDASAEDKVLLKFCYKYSPFVNRDGIAGKSKTVVLIKLATDDDLKYYAKDYIKMKAKREADKQQEAIKLGTVPKDLEPVLEYYIENKCSPEDVIEIKGEVKTFAEVLRGYI